MKKLTFLLLLALTTTFAFAEDVTLTETYSNVVQTSAAAAGTKWNGDYFEWTVATIRRGATDLLADSRLQGGWFSTTNATNGYIKSTHPIEGGIKTLSFPWSQFGNESTRTLKMVIFIDGVRVDSIVRENTTSSAAGSESTYLNAAINSKKNADLALYNLSFTKTNPAEIGGRFVLGNITWTPYLFYTTKAVAIDKDATYTNASLINNLDIDMDAPSFTSSNPAIATVDGTTGEVTAIAEGTATITATSGDVFTTYEFTVNPSQLTPELSYDANKLYKLITDGSFTNTLTNNSDGTVSYASSNESCATVHATTGEVTIVAMGSTTITATVSETENFKSANTVYTLIVKPANWKIETFDNEITNAYYSVAPQTVAGVQADWACFLGGIQKGSSAFPGATNGAAFVRAKFQDADDYGYVASSSMSGGIDSLSFAWNSNGAEATVTWDIRILINGNEVYQFTQPGNEAILEVADTVKIGGLKIDGDFTIKFENRSTTTTEYTIATGGNRGRFAFDDLQWIGYVDATTGVKLTQNDKFGVYPTNVSDMLHIRSVEKDFTVKIYNQLGSLILEQNNVFNIPVNHLPAGMYIVKIQSENNELSINKILKR